MYFYWEITFIWPKLFYLFIFISSPRLIKFQNFPVNQLIKKCWPYVSDWCHTNDTIGVTQMTPTTAKLRVKIVWPPYLEKNRPYIERKFKKKCVRFRTWKSLLNIILSYCIYCKLGHTFLSFSSCYYCTFDNFYTAGCLETISNVDYNISDPSITNTSKKKVLLATKIWFVYFATCQMYLFVCLNHLYCENNKGLLFFRYNENEVTVVVAINRQYLHTVHSVRK